MPTLVSPQGRRHGSCQLASRTKMALLARPTTLGQVGLGSAVQVVSWLGPQNLLYALSEILQANVKIEAGATRR